MPRRPVRFCLFYDFRNPPAWRQDHYGYGELSLRPRPVQTKIPIWIAGLTPPAVRRAARLPTDSTESARFGASSTSSKARSSDDDPEKREIASALMHMHVTRDPERKWREALPQVAYQVNPYAKWTAEAGLGTFAPVTSRSDLEANGCFIATPERACEIVERFVDESQLTRLFSWTIPPGLPPEWRDDHIELMAREVFPNFR
jgi:alkanesulfonate monooxygenase SsuD/methylene tetrahydromethanopterin reductase-like flavin-dependent oxidoreductase (luciferase family)